MTQPRHILMTGAGAPGAAGILHCLKKDPRLRITLADADAEAVGKYLHPDFIVLPTATSPEFTDRILHYCTDHSISHVLPLVTKELMPLASVKEAFEKKGIQVLVPSTFAVTIANNKTRTYKFLEEKEIPVPRYFVVRTVEEFIHAAFELGHPQQPFCFKPSCSNGSRGVRIVSDSLDESELLFCHKPYQLYITYTHALSILSAKPFPELLVSEYLPGMEYTIDCLAEKGNSLVCVPRTREKMNNGISVKGTFVNDESIIRYCRSIIKAIELHGNIGIQVKLSKAGEPLLLEINPRLQGTTVAALGAGVNFPLLGIKLASGEKIQDKELEVQWERRFSRYWTEVFY